MTAVRGWLSDLVSRFSGSDGDDKASKGASGKWGVGEIGEIETPPTADSTTGSTASSTKALVAAPPPPVTSATTPPTAPPTAPGASPLPRSHVAYPFSPSRTHVGSRYPRARGGLGGLGSAGLGRPGPLVLTGGEDPFRDPAAGMEALAAAIAEDAATPGAVDTSATAAPSPLDSPLEPTSPPRSFASLITAPAGYRHVTSGGTDSPSPPVQATQRPDVGDSQDADEVCGNGDGGGSRGGSGGEDVSGGVKGES